MITWAIVYWTKHLGDDEVMAAAMMILAFAIGADVYIVYLICAALAGWK